MTAEPLRLTAIAPAEEGERRATDRRRGEGRRVKAKAKVGLGQERRRRQRRTGDRRVRIR